jgi:hypothetical protein
METYRVWFKGGTWFNVQASYPETDAQGYVWLWRDQKVAAVFPGSSLLGVIRIDCALGHHLPKEEVVPLDFSQPCWPESITGKE